MSNAGSYGRAPGLSARRRSSHTIAPTRSSSSVKAPNFCCDSCLWSDLPKTTEAVYSCVTCLHCYCVSCLRNLAKPSRSKGEAGNVLWFRCPVPMCAIMIQANSQVREVNGKNLPIQLQYLHKSQQTSRGISVMQKTLRFKLDNLKGWVIFLLPLHEICFKKYRSTVPFGSELIDILTDDIGALRQILMLYVSHY